MASSSKQFLFIYFLVGFGSRVVGLGSLGFWGLGLGVWV